MNEKPGATRPEVATLPDQRDGWDDEDSVMLGLDVAVGLDLPAQSLQEDPSPPTQQAISTKVGSQSSCEDQAAVPSSESHTSSKFDAEQVRIDLHTNERLLYRNFIYARARKN